MTINNLFFDEPCHHLSHHVGVRSCFYPLGKVIDSNQNESVSVCSFWLDHPDYTYTPHGERPWNSQDIQRSRWYVYLVCIDHTLMTLLSVFEAIKLHSQPRIPCSENFLSHGVLVGVSSRGSFVNLLDKNTRFLSI